MRRYGIETIDMVIWAMFTVIITPVVIARLGYELYAHFVRGDLE